MEIFSQSHKNLQLFCADFWPSQEDCQLILDDIGVSSGRINMAEPSIMRWLSIIRELMRKNDGSMARLVTVLIKQYPNNKDLIAVCAPWIPVMPAKSAEPVEENAGSPAQGAPSPAPAPAAAIPKGAVLVKKFEDTPKEPVPIVAPPDFADEADLVVPRIDTLWEAMIDVERRLTDVERKLSQPERKAKS